MEDFIRRENLKIFREKLARSRDEEQKRVLRSLIAVLEAEEQQSRYHCEAERRVSGASDG